MFLLCIATVSCIGWTGHRDNLKGHLKQKLKWLMDSSRYVVMKRLYSYLAFQRKKPELVVYRWKKIWNLLAVASPCHAMQWLHVVYRPLCSLARSLSLSLSFCQCHSLQRTPVTHTQSAHAHPPAHTPILSDPVFMLGCNRPMLIYYRLTASYRHAWLLFRFRLRW